MNFEADDKLPEGEFEQSEVEGLLEDAGEAGMLTAVLRGEVGYAYSDEEGWLVLMYPKEKRALRINTEKSLVLETDYYEATRQ